MAGIAVQSHHHRHTSSIGLDNAVTIHGTAPVVEMLPNPDFTFPRRPQPQPGSPGLPPASSDYITRPVSVQLKPPTPDASRLHRRAASTLPSFTFNAEDLSGLQGSISPPRTPEESNASTPSRRGHKRAGSEFVGGDSRFGVVNAVSSSPTKSNAVPLPVPNPMAPPAGRRGHAHRRSQAMSSHDVSSLMHPKAPEPRLSSSLPSTPLDPPTYQTQPMSFDQNPSTTVPHGHTLGDEAIDDLELVRPPSRARVGFADQVEIIPPESRPLSTISSGTESSVSTVRGHSVNNSISSVMNLSNTGTPSTRTPPRSTTIPSFDFDTETPAEARLDKKTEQDGRWLHKSLNSMLARPLSESAASSSNSEVSHLAIPKPIRSPSEKTHAFGRSLAFDRRKSEPMIGAATYDSPRSSAISIASTRSAESATSGASGTAEPKSSRRRIASWAISKLTRRKSKDLNKTDTSHGSTNIPLGAQEQPHATSMLQYGQAYAREAQPEMDLEAVFADQGVEEERHLRKPTQPRIAIMPASPPRFGFDSEDATSPVVDLDAALGPLRTPPMPSGPRRKQLHSSRLTKDFDGPGGHYNFHRRAASSPVSMMAPFEPERRGTPIQTSIPDVFEEEEPEEDRLRGMRPTSAHSSEHETSGTGISIVERAGDERTPMSAAPDHNGLGIRQPTDIATMQSSWEANVTRLPTPVAERRASSVIESTIAEEATPVDAFTYDEIEVVPDHEEPRAASLTKSSDSSEAPTILAQSSMLHLPDGEESLATRDTYQTPDFAGRRSSFDHPQVDTAASSIADGRTVSSCVTGDHRMSIDDVPSLTSSRSTMMSNVQANSSRRDFTNVSNLSCTPATALATLTPVTTAEKRRKRASMQSLSQLIGVKSKGSDISLRSQSAEAGTAVKGKKEHRLKKLMFWRSKQSGRQDST